MGFFLVFCESVYLLKINTRAIILTPKKYWLFTRSYNLKVEWVDGLGSSEADISDSARYF